MNHSNSSQSTQQKRPIQEAVPSVGSMVRGLSIASLFMIPPLVLFMILIVLGFSDFSIFAEPVVLALFVFFGLWFLLSVFFSFRPRWRKLQIARELAQNGQITQGIIYNCWTETRGGGPGGTITDYYVAYQYQPPGGEFLGARQRIGSKIYEGLQVGDTVTVRYLPRDPKYSRIIEWS